MARRIMWIEKKAAPIVATPPESCLRGRRAGTHLLRIAAILVGVTVTPGIVAATDPTIQCRDIRESKLQLEREASGIMFDLPADTQRFIEQRFGPDAGAVLVNLGAVSAYLNSHPTAFEGLNRFWIIGDVTGTTGPIFLISAICTPLCRSFEFHRSSDGFSASQIDIEPQYLIIAYPAEGAWYFRDILASDRGLASLGFTLKDNVPGEVSRFREYRTFGEVAGFEGNRCLQSR
jgi:hypothetical protein